MKANQFNNLTFDNRSSYVSKNGDFITFKEYYRQKRALYNCDKLLVEAWYSPIKNEVTRVELIGHNEALKFYWSSMYIDDLVSLK